MQPVVEKRPSTRSLLIFTILAAYLVLVKTIIVFQPELFRSAAQAAVFEWHFLAVWIVLGFAGVLLALRTGFPEPLTRGSRAKELLSTMIPGVALGILAIGVDRATHWTSLVAAEMKLRSIHIDFPASVLIYPGGAIIVNILYRIFIVPALLWLISNKLLRGQKQATVYWILAALVSLVEPLGDVGLAKFGTGVAVATFGEDYALNLMESYLFRRFGFLAPILLRIHFYLVWHVLWGFLQQP